MIVRGIWQQVSSELFHDNGAPPYRIRKRMVRNEGYKLIRGEGPDQFYRYDPGRLDEGADQVAVAPPMRALAADNVELTGIADDLERTVVYEGP